MIIAAKAGEPVKHTTKPIVTGSSVIAITYKDGVMMATDTLLAYYGMLDFKDVQRIEKISDHTILASTGDHSDFQEVVRLLGEKTKEAFLYDDGVKPTPKDYANYLARVSYGKRNKMNPLYLMNVIAGYSNGAPFLTQVDLYGSYVEAKYTVTGFAGYFCKPIIENYWKPDATEEQARAILTECFKVLFYRDCRAHDRIQIATVTRDGVNIAPPFQLETTFGYGVWRNAANERLHTQ